MIKKTWLILSVSSVLLLSACTPTEDALNSDLTVSSIAKETVDTTKEIKEESEISKEDKISDPESTVSSANTESEESQILEENQPSVSLEGYDLIEVDGGNLSGYREANVVVDIGFGDREYWAFTNEYGQLVRVVADEIILQDDATEPVNANGRYYSDEAKVPGTESSTLDEGHAIADSLGGVANAYNITPQDSILNRNGNQAYMERTIQQAGGATNFEAIITYPNTTTQVPSNYKYTYTIVGNSDPVVDEFENINPDEYNEDQGLTGGAIESSSNDSSITESNSSSNTSEGDISSVDTNGNNLVTITEAKAAGYPMPITKDHWLYQYMRDSDGDGQVGEAE